MPDEETLPAAPTLEDFTPEGVSKPALSPPIPVMDAGPISIPSSMLPMSERAAAAQFTSPRNVMRVRGFEERNIVPGVPLDVGSGVSEWDRLVLATRSAKADQFRYLRTKYGEDKVREADTGDWIVRVDDPKTGKPKDIVADPRKLDLGDFIALAGDVPEVAGYVLAEKGSAALPLLRRAKGVFGVGRDIVAGAGGAETAGAAKDVAVRLGEAPLDLQEIARRRAGQFKTDVALGGVTVPVQRLFQWTKSPFLGAADKTQFDAIAAQKYIKEKYGLEVPLTVGQLTGNPDIIRREKFTGKVLGGTKTYQAFEREQQQAMGKLQNILMGSEPADDAVLGSRMIEALKRKTEPTISGVETAASELEKEAQANINKLIEGQTLAGASLTKTYVGDLIRNRLIALRDAAKAESERLFGEFRSITGDQPTISGQELAKAAGAIKKDAASVFKQKPTGILGPTGLPITRLTQTPSQAFVPETSVMRRLDELISNKSGQYRFSDLQKMRTEVYDDMAKSEAVPGMGAHYLSRIGNALTDAMEKGVAAMPDPRAKTALAAANKHYREQVVPFSEKGIDELFRQADEAGFVGPAQLTSRLLSGAAATDKFNTLKRFLGGSSPEFKTLKRSIADELLLDATDPGSDTLNARKFLKGFSDFSRQNPEIATEVFGADSPKIMEQARFLIRAQEGAKFPADETRKLLASGNPTVTKLRVLMRAESEKDDLFKNQMLKAISEHDTKGLNLTPEDVVNRFINKPERNIGEITETMALLSDRPALVEDIRTKYLESVFRRADAVGKTFAQALADAGGDRKARVVLGNKLFEDLERYGMLLAAEEYPRTIAESAGAMAGGSRMDKLLVHPFRTLKTGLREFATAKILTSSPLRRWATNVNPSDPGALQLILTSAPFVESLARNFGPGREAQNAAQSIKHAMDDWMKGMGSNQPAKGPIPGTQPEEAPPMPTIEEFRKSVRKSVPSNP